MKRDTSVEYEVKSEVQPSSLNEEIQLDLGNGHHEIQLDRDDSQPAGAISKAAEPKPSFFKYQRSLWIGVGAIALAGGTVAAWQWWQFQHAHASTDNAQIEGHISPVAPKIAATVQTVLVKDGDYVQVGQPLIVLEDPDLNLKIQQAEAGLNTAKAQLKSAADTVPLTANTNATQVQQAQSNLDAKQAEINAAQTSVNQTEAGVKAAQAQLQKTQLGIKAAQAQVQQAEAGVRAARAKVVQAQSDVNKTQPDFLRYQSLYNQGAVSAQARDTAEAAYQNAQANLDVANEGVKQAEFQLNNTQAQLSQTQAQVNSDRAQLNQALAQVKNAQAQLQKSQAEAQASKGQLAETRVSGQKVVVQQDQTQINQAQVNQAAAALNLARQQLDYTLIKAPVSGYVGQLTAQIGQKVQSGQPLLSVVPLQSDRIYV
ncbi:MAG TPA: biotin/lipoyl-binding protein, partial [Allocoleopsis sp.]